MKAIEQETGFWKPSAGSLYPLLTSMKKQNLIIEVIEPDGAKRWQITDTGHAAYNEASDSKRELFDSMRKSLVVFSKVFDAGPLESIVERLASWQEGRSDFRTLGPLFMDLHDALWALPSLSDAHQAEARRILEGAIEAFAHLRSTTDAD
jgi:DNA-binding PadR family transcriptional regulator